MFLEKTRRFFSIFPLISASKPMKAAKNDFRGLLILPLVFRYYIPYNAYMLNRAGLFMK